MRIECAAGKADVGGPVVAKPFHQVLAATDDSDRKPPAHGLSICDEVGPDTEIFLLATKGEAQADEDLLEEQHAISLRHHPPHALERVGETLPMHDALH